MLEIQRIRYKNFLSSGNAFIDIDFMAAKRTLIIGKNGNGKSTALTALCFCLFNKDDRGVARSTLINAINKKNAVVETWIKSSGIEYMIRRGLKPNIFEIYCEGKLVDQLSNNKDQQKYLEENILKTNFNTFKQIVILSSGDYVPFMKLTAAQRREVVDNVLELEVFITMNKILKGRLDENKANLAENTTRHNILKSKLESLRDSVAVLKKSKESDKSVFEQTIKEKIVERQELVSKLKEISSSISDKDVDNVSHILTFEKNVKKLESEVYANERTISDNKKLINFFKGHDTCPTCDQEIDHTFKQTKIESLFDVNVKEEKALEELNSKLSKVSTALDKLKKLKDKISLVNQAREKIEMRISSIDSTIEDYRKKIESLNNNNEQLIIDLQDKISDVETDMYTTLQEREDLLKRKETLTALQPMLKDDGMKASFIKRYIPIMNRTINDFLQRMNFYVSFNLDENFNETIKSRHRDEFTYANFSMGERKRIDLALMFTWREIAKLRNSFDCNLICMDEIVDGSMDESGIEDMMEILKGMNCNTIIISHNDTTKERRAEFFDRTLEVKKVNNFTTYKEIKE